MKNIKNIIFYITAFILCNMLLLTSVYAVDYNNVCKNPEVIESMEIIGRFIKIIRWLVPLIILVIGMIDFGKAIISDDEKVIKSASTSFLKRLVAGIAIFFIPTIIIAILNLLQYRGFLTKYQKCTDCMLKLECD